MVPIKFKIIILFLGVFFFSCSTHNKFRIVKFKVYSNTQKQTKIYKATIKLGYKVKNLSGGIEWTEYQYVYLDNSIFYISDEDGNTSVNYYNIRNDSLQSQKSIFAFPLQDTVTLYGKDLSGKFWKNKYDGEVNVGYLNVPLERKKEFDNIIKTMKIKTNVKNDISDN